MHEGIGDFGLTGNLLAGLFGFRRREFFQALEGERANSKVEI